MTVYTLDRRKGLYLKHTATKGRGVFCVSDIGDGEIIEISPAILLDEAATAHVGKTILHDYKFRVVALSNGQRALFHIDTPGKSCCIVMGVMAFCNHDENPNADIYWEEDEGTAYHFLEATRRIPKNTEICTNYGRGWFTKRSQIRR
ncbi:MAG TPA: SET domain-containing protein-lysine N-methyltransferase [Patescibacteria group bacterium]|nr:SET domain-containing protein-lysine N-methyltransferase [Patescibacteria group bacterium]